MKTYITQSMRGVINLILKYVEDHLFEDIKTEYLSSAGALSERQCYRDFYSYTGHSIKEYIRLRRLSKALELIRSSDMSFADIAYECRYSSQQAMNRTIKKITGCTPGEYKKADFVFYFPAYHNNSGFQVEVKSQKMPVFICVTFLQNKAENLEDNALEILRGYIPDYRGRIFGKDVIYGNKKAYELWVEYSENTWKSLRLSAYDNLQLAVGGEAVYATTMVTNRRDTIGAAWNYLYNEWLPKSMFQAVGHGLFEEYKRNSKDGFDKLVLYVMVERKAGISCFTIEECGDRYFISITKRGINAEKRAAAELFRYTVSHYPFIFAKDLVCYSSHRGDEWTSGIEVHKELLLSDNDAASTVVLKKGRYAVLRNDVYGEEAYQSILAQWLGENDVSSDSIPFTLYYVGKPAQVQGGPLEKHPLAPIETYIRIK